MCVWGHVYVLHQNSSWDRKCYLGDMWKTQEVQTACLKFHSFLIPMMEREPRPERGGEQWAAHSFTKKTQMFKLEGLESHRWLRTQKVNYEAMRRKDTYGRHGRISPETVAASHFCIITIITPMTQHYIHIRKIQTGLLRPKIHIKVCKNWPKN